MPIGENETKEQYYRRMAADLEMTLGLLEKDEKHLKVKNNKKIAKKVLEE
mgnify:CR=1 FL=1